MTLTAGRPKRLKWKLLFIVGLAATVFAVRVLTSQTVAVPAIGDGNILKNPGFEQRAGGMPQDWTVNNNTAGKGTISQARDTVHSGQFALKLQPSSTNPADLASDPLGVGQGFPISPFRGKKVYFSGWLAAEGGAGALVTVVVLGARGGPVSSQILQASPQAAPLFQQNVISLPDDNTAQSLVLVCTARGTSGAAYFDDVYLGLQPPPQPPLLPPTPLTAQVSVNAAVDIRTVPPTIYGSNLEWIWDGNGAWNAAQNALDPDLIRLAGDLGPTLLRFPGGVFSDFYHWRDGIGVQQSRPKTQHIPGDPTTSVHRFGTDEALAFADKAGARLLMTVNAASGTAQEAAAWVRYVNGSRRRVDYWEIGNEVYFNGDEPYFKQATMPPGRYASKFMELAKAMRAADPGIKIGVVGDDNYPDRFPHAYANWDQTVLKQVAGEADFMAVHNAYAPSLYSDPGYSLREVYAALFAAPVLIRRNLAAAAGKITAIGQPAASRIKLGITEWGPYFQTTPDGRFVDHAKTLGSALYVASTLKVFVETPSVELATAFKLADNLFMGWIGKRSAVWTPTAPYFALQMYTRHFGPVLVQSSTTAPGYNSQPVGMVDAVSNVAYLDVLSSRSSDRGTLFVIGINKHFDLPIQARITVAGVKGLGSGTAWTLNGTGIDANTGTQPFQTPAVKQAIDDKNPRFYSGGPDEVKITSASFPNSATVFSYTFPAHSVTSLELPVK